LGIPQKSSGKVSQHWESPKKVLASFPNIGNVPKKFWQAFPTLGMFQKSSGKVSQHWESSTEVLANIPNVGTVFSEKK